MSAPRHNATRSAPAQKCRGQASVMDTVLGAISDLPKVVQGMAGMDPHNHGPQQHEALPERVVWIKFDHKGKGEFGRTGEAQAQAQASDGDRLPLVLLGYDDGLQIWDTEDPLNVHEVVSLRQGPVFCAKVLNTPPPTGPTGGAPADRFATVRPVMAFCEDGGDLASRCCVKLMSLNSPDANLDLRLNLQHPVLDILCNVRVVAVATEAQICLHDTRTFALVRQVEDCATYADPHRGLVLNPMALGTEWLAYASTTLLRKAEPGAQGGLDPTAAGSLVAETVGLVQKTSAELWHLSGAGIQTVSDMMNGASAGGAHHHHHHHGVRGAEYEPTRPTSEQQSGVVKVVGASAASADQQPIAHFWAHLGASSTAVTLISFNRDGTLLITADEAGQHFHVFLLAHHDDGGEPGHHHHHVGVGVGGLSSSPASLSSTPTDARGGHGQHGQQHGQHGQHGQGHGGRALDKRPLLRPRHIYTLQRGVTTGLMQHVSFSLDSRWVAMTSERGTVHVFAIRPRGGPVSAASHVAPCVKNAGRFFTSAGLQERSAGAMHRPVVVGGATAQLKFPAAKANPAPSTTHLPPAPGRAVHSSGHLAKRVPSTACLIKNGHVSTCFGGSGFVTEPGRGGPSYGTVSLMVGSLEGSLVQHELYVHYGDDVEAVGKSAREAEGVVVHQTAQAGFLSATLDTLGQIVARPTGQPLRQRPAKNAVPYGGGSPAKAGGQAEDARPHATDAMGVVCLATQWWNVRREPEWSAVARKLDTADGGSGSGGGNGGNSGAAAHATADDSGDTGAVFGAVPKTADWLSRVEIKTYQDGDRKIWMGPQFRLMPCDDVGSAHGEATARTGLGAAGGTRLHPSSPDGHKDEDEEGAAKGVLNEFTKRISFSSGSLPDSPQITVPAERLEAGLAAASREAVVKRAIAEAMALGNGGCEDHEDREVREAAVRSTRDPSTLSDVDDLDGMFALDD